MNYKCIISLYNREDGTWRLSQGDASTFKSKTAKYGTCVYLQDVTRQHFLYGRVLKKRTENSQIVMPLGYEGVDTDIQERYGLHVEVIDVPRDHGCGYWVSALFALEAGIPCPTIYEKDGMNQLKVCARQKLQLQLTNPAFAKRGPATGQVCRYKLLVKVYFLFLVFLLHNCCMTECNIITCFQI